MKKKKTENYGRVSHGVRAIFTSVERNANDFSAKCLLMLAGAAIVLVSIGSLVDQSEYMQEVRIAMTVLVAICAAVGIYCIVKKKQTRYRKFVLCFAWFVALALAVTYIDSSVALLYAIPVLIAIRYNSVVFTLFVSLFNIIFAFFPYVINTYRGAYPLDFVVLKPGTVIEIAGNSLDGTVNALGDQIMRSETITNMLSYGYLSVALLLILISAIAVSFSAYNRNMVMDQYKKARGLMEVDKK